jgi:hypothetical protein
LGINQANSLLKVSGILRERVWQLCGLQYARILVNIDTTVKTVYGQVQGARKGHNPKHRGKPEETANLQDLLIFALRGISVYGERLKELGAADRANNDFIA